VSLTYCTLRYLCEDTDWYLKFLTDLGHTSHGELTQLMLLFIHPSIHPSTHSFIECLLCAQSWEYKDNNVLASALEEFKYTLKSCYNVMQ
jgi:hypothetical protein